MIKWLPVLWVSSITRIGRYIFHQRNVHWLWQWLCWLNPLQWLQVKQKTHRLNSTFAGLWSHVRNNLYPCMSQDVFGQCTKSPTRFAYIQTVRWFSNSFRPLFSWEYTDILITFLHIYITIPLKANTVVKNVTAFANRPDPLSQCESVVNALKMLDLNSIWGASKSFERKHAPHLLLRFCILRACSERRAFGSPETSLFFMSKLRTESLSQGRGSHKSCIQESERLCLLITLAQMFFHSGWPLFMAWA